MTYLARMKVLVDVQATYKHNSRMDNHLLTHVENVRSGSRENFPFTNHGIVPDIVINPHAFPSRQIPGQLLEAALGKGIACGGSKRYATPVFTLSVDDIVDQLHRAKFSRWGNERVYNGRAGEMECSLVFVGPIFYQRLIHMAEDKVKFRNTGPVHPLTRHPAAGFGGIKFGEIERDCLVECLFTFSDSSEMHICRKCKKCGQRDPTGSAWWPQGQGSLLPGL
ncbi:hypothetical protein NC651_017319 [Populus alba x Populus x berolinensis]|nr:hypothetical protein NC651_017319 [Populus alba x Populus x berolinensis]